MSMLACLMHCVRSDPGSQGGMGGGFPGGMGGGFPGGMGGGFPGGGGAGGQVHMPAMLPPCLLRRCLVSREQLGHCGAPDVSLANLHWSMTEPSKITSLRTHTQLLGALLLSSLLLWIHLPS